MNHVRHIARWLLTLRDQQSLYQNLIFCVQLKAFLEIFNLSSRCGRSGLKIELRPHPLSGCIAKETWWQQEEVGLVWSQVQFDIEHGDGIFECDGIL